MHKGWIMLHRQLLDCWLWHDKEPFDKRSAWVDLLLFANHEDTKMLFNGEVITIKRGQYSTSIRKLSEKWKWSYDKTARYLKILENDGMIKRESDNFRTLLTIENYEVYQNYTCTNRAPISEQSEHEQVNSPYTHNSTNRARTVHEQVTNNNDNNDNNVNNDKNDKNVKSKEKGSYEPKKKNEPYFPDDERLEFAFREFLSMRVKTKKPITSKQGMTRMLNKLQQLAGDDNDLAVKILEQSTDHCWTDIYELKTDSDWGRKKTNYNQPIDWDNI